MARASATARSASSRRPAAMKTNGSQQMLSNGTTPGIARASSSLRSNHSMASVHRPARMAMSPRMPRDLQLQVGGRRQRFGLGEPFLDRLRQVAAGHGPRSHEVGELVEPQRPASLDRLVEQSDRRRQVALDRQGDAKVLLRPRQLDERPCIAGEVDRFPEAAGRLTGEQLDLAQLDHRPQPGLGTSGRLGIPCLTGPRRPCRFAVTQVVESPSLELERGEPPVDVGRRAEDAPRTAQRLLTVAPHDRQPSGDEDQGEGVIAVLAGDGDDRLCDLGLPHLERTRRTTQAPLG